LLTVTIPYARTHLTVNLPDERVKGVLRSQLDGYRPRAEDREIVARSLERPIGCPRLAELCQVARRVLVITSDHTRPLPSWVTLPLLLEEIRRGNPSAEVRILVATGCHRASTREEMATKFGEKLAAAETFVMHDCRDASALVYKGRLPSGGELWVNSLVDWAELVVAEGLIEPHSMAGFSGGRKSILPGIAGERTVLANHWAGFVAHPRARTGNLEGNPVHEDMVHAARQVGLGFILNVVINGRKEIVASFAGHPEKAHEAGCDWVSGLTRVAPAPADIVITSNGGYPLDQNIYQALKGMTAAEAACRPGGVIIMVSACEDGHGGEAFYEWFRRASGPEEVARRIAIIPREKTLPDQWGAQILARILTRRKVVLVTDRCSPELVASMHMLHAPTVGKALEIADALAGPGAGITVVPDGVSVIVEAS